MRFTKRADLVVVGPQDGERWSLAIDMIDGPDQRFIMIGELLIYEDRDRMHPVENPALVIEVDGFDWWKPGLDAEYRNQKGQDAVDQALGQIGDLVAADRRFAELIRRRGTHYKLVFDYETGAILLASVDSAGTLHWESTA